MKPMLRNLLFYILIAATCVSYPIAEEATIVNTEVVMTPDQFDESLRLDKAEIDLDNALQLDLSSKIDSINSASVPLSSSTINGSPNTESGKTRSAQHPATLDEDASIEFQFEDADLQNLLTQISVLFNVTFLTDDALTPLPAGGKALKGNKISFKTNQPLTKAQAWNLFVTFLDIAGFAIVPEPDPHFLRISSTPAARTSPIPAYLGVKAETLPDNDQLIRYLYFVENSSLDTINPIINALRSSASSFIVLKDLNAFVLTDKSQNIKGLMAIVTELDRVTMPQSMSVLKLRRADALDVKKLYDSIGQPEEQNAAARLLPVRRQSSAFYFPENTRMIAEPRTNALILLGPLDGIKKIEEFITKFVDVELGEETLSPLRVYTLKYADAKAVADIMNSVTQFGKSTVAGKTGGVRDGDKYIKNLVFIGEPDTNQLIIKGDEEDYLQAKEVIIKLDEPQPQIAMEVLIITVDLSTDKELGTQIRTRVPSITNGLVGGNVDFQTSGLAIGTAAGGVNSGIITNNAGPGVDRLLGNLITLVTGAGPGNTVVTFGSDMFGVWGIFNALQTITNSEVISNPFLTTTNKQRAKVSIGQERRVISGQTINSLGGTTNSFASDKASLDVIVTPQINSDGMIVLDLDISITDFTNPIDQTDATKNTRNVKTTTIVADKEVLAIGGLIQNNISSTISKVPLLGNIPIFGWLFKSKTKSETRDNLIILISTRILQPGERQGNAAYTQDRIREYHGTLDEMHEVTDKRDPIHRMFFKDAENSTAKVIDDFIFERNKSPKTIAKNKKRKVKKEHAQQQQQKNKSQTPEFDKFKKTPMLAQSSSQTRVADRTKKSLATLLDAQPTAHSNSGTKA